MTHARVAYEGGGPMDGQIEMCAGPLPDAIYIPLARQPQYRFEPNPSEPDRALQPKKRAHIYRFDGPRADTTFRYRYSGIE